MARLALVALTLVSAFGLRPAAADDPARAAYWIWHESADASRGVPAGATIYLRRPVEVTETVAEARLRITRCCAARGAPCAGRRAHPATRSLAMEEPQMAAWQTAQPVTPTASGLPGGVR